MLSKAIKKVSFTAVMTFLKVRLGVATLGMLVGGPLGLLLVLVQLGPPAFDLLQEFLDSSDNLDDVNRATGGDRGLDVSPEGVPTMRNVISVGPDGVPTSVPSPLSSLGPASVSSGASRLPSFDDLSEEQKNEFLKRQERFEGADPSLNNPGNIMGADAKGRIIGKRQMSKFGGTLSNKKTSHGTLLKFPTLEQGKAAHRDLFEQRPSGEPASPYKDLPLDQALDKYAPGHSQGYRTGILGFLSPASNNQASIDPAANNMTPEKNPLMNVGIIGELSRFYEMATGQPLVINNNQSSSVVGGGGGGDNRPGAQPVHAPNSGEQDRLRDMLYPRGMLT